MRRRRKQMKGKEKKNGNEGRRRRRRMVKDRKTIRKAEIEREGRSRREKAKEEK